MKKVHLHKRFALVLVVVMAVGFLAGCGGAAAGSSSGQSAGTSAAGSTGSTGSAASGELKELIYAVPEAPAYMDPHKQASITVFRTTTNIFDRLVNMDNNLQIQPSLAESWEVVDGQTMLFHLRDDVNFHNGDHMTAEDVKWSLERTIATPAVNYNYLIIQEIEVVDDYTLKIVTSEPFNAMLQRLSLDAASIVNRRAVEEGEEKFNQHPIGTGPFKFVSWQTGGDVVLEANDEYFMGRPEIDRLVIRHIPEAINRTIGLETGEVDIALDLAITDIETVKANDNLQFIQTETNCEWYLSMNCEDEKFQDVRVRQAIAYALNIPDLIGIAFGGVAEPANFTSLTPKLAGYHPPENTTYTHDLEKANELMAEAGYADGMKATIVCRDRQLDSNVGVVIQGQLRQIGIELEVEVLEEGNFLQKTGEGDYEMMAMTKCSVDTDSMLRSLYHTEALGPSGNKAFWTDPEIDRLLDEACSTTDMDAANEMYAQVQEIAAENVPIIPLVVEYLNAGMQNNISGFELFPAKSHHIYGTRID